MISLLSCHNFIYPEFLSRNLSDRYDLKISHDDECVYAQSVSDPDLKVLVAYPSELEDSPSTIKDRLEYLERK